jgi:DNA-binding NarL/FixJ family response regulator
LAFAAAQQAEISLGRAVNGVRPGAFGANARILLVDDHQLFRRGLREMLERHGFIVAGEAADAETAVRLAAELAPDVVIMDLNVPGMYGIEATRQIVAVSPSPRVLALTLSTDERDVSAAVLAGACGYLLKDAAPEEIVAGVRAALEGGSLLSPRIARDLLERVRREESVAEAGIPRPQLTERELDVLRLMTAGWDNSKIAKELFISAQTVKSHVSHVLAKLGVRNRVQAAVCAVRRRLV